MCRKTYFSLLVPQGENIASVIVVSEIQDFFKLIRIEKVSFVENPNIQTIFPVAITRTTVLIIYSVRTKLIMKGQDRK